MRDHQTWGMDHSGNSHGGTWSLWWDWHFPYAYWARMLCCFSRPLYLLQQSPANEVSSSPLHLLNPTFSEGISTVTSDLRLLKQISDPAQRHLCYGTHKKKLCGGTSPKLSHQVTRPYPLEAAQHPEQQKSSRLIKQPCCGWCIFGGCVVLKIETQKKTRCLLIPMALGANVIIACDIIAFGLLNESQAWNTIDFIPRPAVGFGSIALSGKVAGRASGRLAAISSGLQCIESRAWSFCEMWSAENGSNKPESNRPAFYSLLSNMFLMLDSD